MLLLLYVVVPYLQGLTFVSQAGCTFVIMATNPWTGVICYSGESIITEIVDVSFYLGY